MGLNFRCLVLILLAGAPLWAWQDDREDPLARFQADTDAYLALWRHGNYAEALTYLEDAIEGSSDGVPMRWLYDRAELSFVLGRVNDAITAIEWLHYRRPAPVSALQLALFQKTRGYQEDYQRTLERAASRYKRFKGEKDDTENTIAIIRIRELMGENPRSLFQELSKIEDEDTEDMVAVALAAGDLAFRKFDYQLAATEYEKALELDKENLDARAGLAECFWKSADPRMEPTMEAVHKINPRHPRILGIKAEMALDAGNTLEAMKHIEAYLEVNPNHRRFLGYKAAAYFLDDDLDAMRVVHQSALLYNSHDGEVYRITGRLASRHYRFAEAAKFQEKAIRVNPNDAMARAYYAFDLLRLGEDAGGRRELEASFEADRFNVQVYNMLELLDTLDTFETVKRGPFEVKMPAVERKVWGDEVLDLLQEAYERYETEYDVALSNPIYLQIFDNHDDFMVRSVGLPGSIGYLGICFGKLITMDTPSARDKGSMNWRATLWHEFVHVVTLQKTKNRMPRWLSEGISVYEETRHTVAWGQRPTPNYKVVVEDMEIPRLQDMELFFTQPKTQFHVMFGYYLGGEFVRFYAEKYGHGALVRALGAIGNGKNTVDALVGSSGTTADALNDAFASYVKDLIAPYKNLPNPEPGLLGGAMMPGSTPPFTNAMQEAAQAMEEARYDDAERWLQEAEALFPGSIGPSSPLTLLADLYETTGQVEQRQAALEKLFSLDGTDWRTCHSLGKIYKDAKAWDKLEEVAMRGLSIDPFDVGMRRALLQAYIGSKQSKNALEELDLLVRLDPDHEIDYRLERVDLHLASKQMGKARVEVLSLLEEVPYSWEAQRRLLKIASADTSR